MACFLDTRSPGHSGPRLQLEVLCANGSQAIWYMPFKHVRPLDEQASNVHTIDSYACALYEVQILGHGPTNKKQGGCGRRISLVHVCPRAFTAPGELMLWIQTNGFGEKFPAGQNSVLPSEEILRWYSWKSSDASCGKITFGINCRLGKQFAKSTQMGKFCIPESKQRSYEITPIRDAWNLRASFFPF